jgi:hypothetical protein
MPITLISDHKIFLIIKYSFELFFSDKWSSYSKLLEIRNKL